MAKARRKLEISEDGLINDIEAEILRMCKHGFDDHDILKYLDKPREFDDVNPNEVTLANLPALYSWCSGFSVDRNAMGGLGGSSRSGKRHKVSRKFEFYCQIQYIMSEVETREASKKLKRLAWWLFDLVDGNLDLDGFVVGSPEMQEVELFPKWRIVGDELRTVSNFNIKIVYPFVDRSTISRR